MSLLPFYWRPLLGAAVGFDEYLWVRFKCIFDLLAMPTSLALEPRSHNGAKHDTSLQVERGHGHDEVSCVMLGVGIQQQL